MESDSPWQNQDPGFQSLCVLKINEKQRKNQSSFHFPLCLPFSHEVQWKNQLSSPPFSYFQRLVMCWPYRGEIGLPSTRKAGSRNHLALFTLVGCLFYVSLAFLGARFTRYWVREYCVHINVSPHLYISCILARCINDYSLIDFCCPSPSLSMSPLLNTLWWHLPPKKKRRKKKKKCFLKLTIRLML